MKVEKDRVVGFDYVLTDETDKVLDKSEGRNPMYYLHGHGNIVPGLEEALEGKGKGDSFDVTLEPEKAYGQRDESRTFEVPRSELGSDVQPQKGMVLTMQSPNGVKIPVTILKVKLRTVLLDGNHQLAGKTLHFVGKIVEVRKAKKEELAHRHAHGPGHGHGH